MGFNSGFKKVKDLCPCFLQNLVRNAKCPVFFPSNVSTAFLTTCRMRLKCDGTRAETRFRLSAKQTSPFKSAGGVSSVDYWQSSYTHQPAGFVLLVRACVLQSCDVYWLPHSILLFPLHLSYRASRCAITFQTQSTNILTLPAVLGSTYKNSTNMGKADEEVFLVVIDWAEIAMEWGDDRWIGKEKLASAVSVWVWEQ